ncbi:TPA: hypothetical protein ACX6Q1_003808 [Photobacterium damselae]
MKFSSIASKIFSKAAAKTVASKAGTVATKTAVVAKEIAPTVGHIAVIGTGDAIAIKGVHQIFEDQRNFAHQQQMQNMTHQQIVDTKPWIPPPLKTPTYTYVDNSQQEDHIKELINMKWDGVPVTPCAMCMILWGLMVWLDDGSR